MSHLKATSLFLFSRSIWSCWVEICFTTTNQHDGASTTASPCSGNTAWETHPFTLTSSVIKLSTLTPPSQLGLVLFITILNFQILHLWTFSLYSFVDFPGLTIRMKTWIYRFLCSAYTATTMTRPEWVSSTTRKGFLFHSKDVNECSSLFMPGWRFMCFGPAECFWTFESLRSLPFNREDRD